MSKQPTKRQLAAQARREAREQAKKEEAQQRILSAIDTMRLVAEGTLDEVMRYRQAMLSAKK